MTGPPPTPPLSPSPALSRSRRSTRLRWPPRDYHAFLFLPLTLNVNARSEEHTSELQSQSNLLFRLFFLNDRPPPDPSPLPLPGALPISPITTPPLAAA